MNQLSIVVPFYWNPGLPTRLINSIKSTVMPGLDCEFIIVDWSPQTGSEAAGYLHKASIPFNTSVRIIKVTHEAHSTCPGHRQMPILEYVAKNVGIRRARYEAVLSTNADILFSREMMQRLKQLDIYDGCFYRADRTDLSFEPGSETLELAKESANRTVPADEGAAGDFTLMSKANWYELRGYPEFISSDTIDSYLVQLAKSHGMGQINLPEAIYHQPHQLNRRGWPRMPWNPSFVGVRNGSSWGLEVFDFEEITL